MKPSTKLIWFPLLAMALLLAGCLDRSQVLPIEKCQAVKELLGPFKLGMPVEDLLALEPKLEERYVVNQDEVDAPPYYELDDIELFGFKGNYTCNIKQDGKAFVLFYVNFSMDLPQNSVKTDDEVELVIQGLVKQLTEAYGEPEYNFTGDDPQKPGWRGYYWLPSNDFAVDVQCADMSFRRGAESEGFEPSDVSMAVTFAAYLRRLPGDVPWRLRFN